MREEVLQVDNPLSCCGQVHVYTYVHVRTYVCTRMYTYVHKCNSLWSAANTPGVYIVYCCNLVRITICDSGIVQSRFLPLPLEDRVQLLTLWTLRSTGYCNGTYMNNLLHCSKCSRTSADEMYTHTMPRCHDQRLV